jgi:hypothetical protein
MKNWKLKSAALLTLLFLLFGTSEVAYQVLIGNQERGLYPADADSISIPLMAGEIVCFLVFVFATVGVLLPNTKVFGLLGLVFIGFGCLLTLSSAAEWMIPHHFELSIAYLVDSCMLLGLIVWSWRRRKSTMSSQQEKQ